MLQHRMIMVIAKRWIFQLWSLFDEKRHQPKHRREGAARQGVMPRTFGGGGVARNRAPPTTTSSCSHRLSERLSKEVKKHRLTLLGLHLLDIYPNAGPRVEVINPWAERRLKRCEQCRGKNGARKNAKGIGLV